MRDGILWLLIAVYAFVTVLADAFPRTFSSPANLPLGIVIPLLFALVHGAVRYGAKGIFSFMVLCLGISNVMENMGVLTGFPFGRYHYTDVLGPKLFLVPLLIGPAYFGTGYLSWVLATCGSTRTSGAMHSPGLPFRWSPRSSWWAGTSAAIPVPRPSAASASGTMAGRISACRSSTISAGA